MKYKLMALDLDGTLLNSSEEISDTNILFVKKALEAGVKIIITTGRSTSSARRFIQTIRSPDPFITYNGAIIHNGDMVLRTLCLNHELVQDTVEVLKELNQLPVIYTVDDHRYYENLGNHTKGFFEFSRGSESETFKVNNLMGRRWERVIRLSIFTDEEGIPVLEHGLSSNLGSRIKTIQTFFPEWNFWIFEILNNLCSKSNSLDYICRLYGIKRDRVIAVGDNLNDLDMLQWAGMGVAMRNALPDVCEQADYVTEKSNNEHGVSEVIQKFILPS